MKKNSLNLFQNWSSGDKSQVLNQILTQYRHTLEEEFRIQSDSLDFLLAKVRRYLRLYTEELLLDDASQQLAIVEKVCFQFLTNYCHWDSSFICKDNLKYSAERFSDLDKLNLVKHTYGV